MFQTRKVHNTSIIHAMIRMSIHIFVRTETRWPGAGQTEIEDSQVYYAGEHRVWSYEKSWQQLKTRMAKILIVFEKICLSFFGRRTLLLSLTPKTFIRTALYYVGQI